MRAFRPCSSCGRDNDAAGESCAACGTTLTAWASEPDRRPVREARLGRPARRALGLLLLVGLGATGAWLLRGEREVDPAQTLPTWRRPDSIAGWAARRLEARGAPPERILALIEDRTSRPLRLVIAAQAPETPVREAVRAAAELLLAARGEGERLLTHAVLLELGPRDERVSVLVPLTDAARLLLEEAQVASLWSRALPGELPALAGLPKREPKLPPAPPPVELAKESEAQGADQETMASTTAATQVADDPDPDSEAEGGRAAQAPVQVGTGSTRAGADEGPPAEAQQASSASTAEEKPPQPAMPVSLLQGPGRRPSHSYQAGEQGVILLRAMIHPRQRRPLILRSLRVQARGTLNDVDGIDFIHLVQDLDRNGLRDPADRQIGDVQAFGDDDGSAVFPDLDLSFGADNMALHLLLVVDFLDQNEGGTIMLTIPDAEAIQIEDVTTGTLVRVDGAPLNGAMTSLDGDLEPDPFQEELDRLAAEGE